METTVNDVIGWLEPAINAGVHITLSKDKKGYWIDLNTNAKSQCLININNGEVTAHMRYGKSVEINGFYDILMTCHGCAHGRPYFNESWIEVFTQYGMSDPRGNI